MNRISVMLLACVCCLAGLRPAAGGPALPKKADVVFSDDFEQGSAPGWSGAKVLTGAPCDTRGALGAAEAGGIVTRSVTFDSTSETYMTFRYYAQECYSIGVQFNDRTLGDNFKTFITPIERGKWATVTFNVTADIQGCSDHTAGIRAADSLANVLVWPMEKLTGGRLIIDDVAIYRLGLPGRAARMLADLAAAEKQYAPADALARDLERLRGDAAQLVSEKQAVELEEKCADLIGRMKRASLLTQVRRARGDPKAQYVVGIESPLVRVCDRNPQMPFLGRLDKACALAAAGHEYENVQLVVIPVEKDLEAVKVAFTDLAGAGGTIGRENLQWRLADDVRTKPSYGYPRSLHGWKPDPLLPGEPFNVKVGQMKCVWVTVYVPPNAGPGEYSGSATIAPGNAPPVNLTLNLRVWNFRLPLRGRFRHMCQFQPQSAERRRENYAFLLRYRFSPTAQYSRSPSPVAEDIPFCLQHGITTFVAGNHPGPEVNVDVVRPYYQALKDAGCLDLAVIYIGDEGTSAEQLAAYRRKALTVKTLFPGLRVIVGGSTPRKELNDLMDVWDPIMSMTAGAGQGYEFHPQSIAERKALGEEVLWYMAGVRPPYPSIELDPPTPSIRMFSWITWKYGIGGWELYGTQGGWDKPTNRTWPKTPWDTYTWRNYNGSGQFAYPGPDGVPLASIRLENARDGIEDYEALALLSDALDLAASKPAAGLDAAMLAEAKKIAAVRPDVLTNMWDWTRDPQRIRAARDEVSRTLDWLVGALGRQEFDEFVARQAQARRNAANDAYEKRLQAFLTGQAGADSRPAPSTRP